MAVILSPKAWANSSVIGFVCFVHHLSLGQLSWEVYDVTSCLGYTIQSQEDPSADRVTPPQTIKSSILPPVSWVRCISLGRAADTCPN